MLTTVQVLERKAVPVAGDDLAWLAALKYKLWDVPTSRSCNSLWRVLRPLSVDELRRLSEMILGYQLPCVMNSDCYGHFALVIYNHTEVFYPEPELLFIIDADHLPSPAPLPYIKFSDYVWDVFSMFAGSLRNRELAAFYGLEQLKERYAYEY